MNDIFNFTINAEYEKPSSEALKQMRAGSDRCLIKKTDNIFPAHTYYEAGHEGTNADMYTRRFVLEQLQKVANHLLPNYGLMIFDAFRTIETQTSLFNLIYDDVKKQHPTWNHEQLMTEAKRYAAHPNEPSRFAIPPHNSGGAIDLAIYEIQSGKMCNFGTAFDEVSEISSTHFFEAPFNAEHGFTQKEWQEIQRNRRVLFNLMKKVGFVNYAEEWWHYDLGDCLWATELGIEWVFGSMEKNAHG